MDQSSFSPTIQIKLERWDHSPFLFCFLSFFFFLHSLLPFTEVLKIYNVLNPTLTLYSISSPISWCDEPGRSSVICIKTISSVTQAQIEFPEFQELQAPGKGIGKAIKKKKRLRTSQVALVVEKLSASAGDIRDAASIPGSGSSSRGGHGK